MNNKILIVLAAGFLTACTSAFLVPDRFERVTPDRLDLKYEDVWFGAQDGVKLHAWYLKAEHRRGTVLFFHGNAQNISAHIASVYWLPKYGFDVFMLDPRGYGRSDGTAAIDGVHMDAEAALKYISKDACGEIIVFGQSFGGALAIYTVADSHENRCVRGVVVEGTFSSYRRIAEEKLGEFWLTWALQWPLSFLFSEDYSPERFVGHLSPTPLLIVQGEDDGIVPPHHAQLLYEAAKEPRDIWLFPHVGHIDAFRDTGRRERIVHWMQVMLDSNVSLRK